MTTWWDTLLDATVVRSFDRSGFLRHARGFQAGDLDVDLRGRQVLVTGANSGIGLETSRALAARGAHVHLLCRDRSRGEAARADVAAHGGQASLVVVDVSDLASLNAALPLLLARVDVLVHNAGVLPAARQVTPQGHELTVATNLIGPWWLTRRLTDRFAPGARVLFVSSGGMYPVRLSPRALFDPPEPFDGVAAYAQTKRAQVELTPVLAERLAGRAVVHTMHPGWADTPAVASSLPRFHAWTRHMLRTPAEGADTVVWLAAAEAPRQETGGFWFDRRRVPTAPLPWTRTGPEVSAALAARLDALTA